MLSSSPLQARRIHISPRNHAFPSMPANTCRAWRTFGSVGTLLGVPLKVKAPRLVTLT